LCVLKLKRFACILALGFRRYVEPRDKAIVTKASLTTPCRFRVNDFDQKKPQIAASCKGIMSCLYSSDRVNVTGNRQVITPIYNGWGKAVINANDFLADTPM